MGALYEPCEIGKVLMELGATSRTQRIPSYRPTVAEGLLDCNIATIFQLAQMRPKVAVRFGENLRETAERHELMLREQNTDCESHPMLKQTAK